MYSRSWDLELTSSWSSKQRWKVLQPEPQSSLSTALVFLASYESGTRLIVSTLLLQVPRGLVQTHQLLVSVSVFLPTPDLETLLQSAAADNRRKEGTSLRVCGIPTTVWRGPVLSWRWRAWWWTRPAWWRRCWATLHWAKISACKFGFGLS